MTLTSVLTVLEGRAGDEALLGMALDLARARALAVELLAVKPPRERMVPLVADGMTGGAVGEIVEALEDQAASRLEETQALYQRLCVDGGVPTSEEEAGQPGFRVHFEVDEGDIEVVVASRGQRCDLIALARPVEAEDRLYAPALEAALFTTGRPVLLSPSEKPKGLGSRVLVAWNDGAESARALAAAMPFLIDAETVDVVAIQDAGCEADPAAMTPYMKRHGIEATCRRLDPDYRDLGEQLLDEAKACEADLLVMGASGHSRLRELVLGGVTRQILATATIPVLMMH